MPVAPKKAAASKPAKFVIPKSLGACADLLYDLRAERYAKNKEVEAIEAKEKAIKAHFVVELKKKKMSGVTGASAHVQYEREGVPVLKNKKLLFDYMVKMKRPDLLQNRISEAAIKELWDDGKKVPGVDKFFIDKIGCTKK